MSTEDFHAHLNVIVKAISSGRVVPFLGAGANLCDRPSGRDWRPEDTEFLPHGGELAAHLAKEFGYPLEPFDLPRVSQYVAVMSGTGPLYDELRVLFDLDYPPTSLHRFLAGLPAMLRAKGYPRTYDPFRRRLVLVTTNYDDMLERSLDEAGEEFHLVIYIADGPWRGKFFHRPPSGSGCLVERPNEYRELVAPHDLAPIVLKLHGAVDRLDGERDSYVITEDHYIEYLARMSVSSLIPAPLPTILRRSHFLFLGYGLRDWNLRVILHRLWGDRDRTWKSWSVQLDPDELDRKSWHRRDVEIVNRPLDEYVDALAARLRALPERSLAPGEAAAT